MRKKHDGVPEAKISSEKNVGSDLRNVHKDVLAPCSGTGKAIPPLCDICD